MKDLNNIYKEVGQQFIDDLFKDYLVVTEKLSGSSFSFEKENHTIKFYKSNDKPINLVDRTLMIYYENPISYIKDITKNIINTIPENWKFCFQYFVHNEPGVIQYDKLPKNSLVLTHIQIKSPNGKIGKIIEDPRVIYDWANVLNVTPLLPIFKGYLTDEQKQKIRDFISTPREDHAELFNTTSFASYIINALNPSVSSTMLQSDLTKPIDSIIFKFYKPGTTQTFSAKMIDPYTVSLMKDREPIDPRRVPADINEILLLDILAFIEERGLRKGEILSSSPDERYIELVSNIFNDYVTRRGSGLKDIEIEKADFAKGDEFKLNIDLIPSETTKNLLKDNERLQDLFKIMLGSLRKKRNPNKTGNVLTPSVVNDFNSLIDRIEELTFAEVSDEFKTFGDYLNLKATNESYQNAEELVLEETVLSINEFINLGKINLNQNIENMKYLKNYDSFHESKLNERMLNVELTKGNPKGELLGVIDSTSNDYESVINSVKISISTEAINAIIDKKCDDGNIIEPLIKEKIKTILRPGWRGGDRYDEFINLSTVNLAKTDHNKYDLNTIIQLYSGFFDSKVLTNLLNESGRIGGINVGKGEYFLAMLTDYTRPPKGQSGDLWFDGSVEVKDSDARLGGTDIKRDGSQSVKEFCEIIGLSYNADSYKLDTLKKHIIPFIEENENTLFKNKSLMKTAINSMSNYDIVITDDMIKIFKNIYKNPSQFESYLGALQLYSYNIKHNHKQILFIDTNKKIMSSFRPTNDFLDSWNFVQANLKFSASSWHGRHAPNKSGLSVNLS